MAIYARAKRESSGDSPCLTASSAANAPSVRGGMPFVFASAPTRRSRCPSFWVSVGAFMVTVFLGLCVSFLGGIGQIFTEKVG